jgi:hypothetical protein
LDRLPVIRRWDELRDWSRRRLKNPKRATRAHLIIKETTRRIDANGIEFRSYAPDAVHGIEELRGIIPNHELAQLIKDVDPSRGYNIESTCRAMLRAAELVEIYYQAKIQTKAAIAKSVPVSLTGSPVTAPVAAAPGPNAPLSIECTLQRKAQRRAAFVRFSAGESERITYKVIAKRASTPDLLVSIASVESFFKGRGEDAAPSCKAIWALLNTKS